MFRWLAVYMAWWFDGWTDGCSGSSNADALFAPAREEMTMPSDVPLLINEKSRPLFASYLRYVASYVPFVREAWEEGGREERPRFFQFANLLPRSFQLRENSILTIG